MSDTANKQAHRKILLDHFHHPRGKAELTENHIISSSRNPMCGDEVEVGLLIGENGNADIRFSGRGCSICIASASILVEAVSGEKLDQLREQHQRISVWLVGDSDNAPEQMSVRALDSVRQLPARKRCMLLAWEALGESISKMEIR